MISVAKSPPLPSLTLTAVNDNPGGSTAASLALSGLVSVMARAYVAQLLKDPQ